MRYHNVKEKHILSGKTIIISSRDKNLDGKKVRIEDWCCNLSGKLCTDNCNANNRACMNYILREDECDLPMDNNVVYTKDIKTGLGYIIHSSEIKTILINKEKTMLEKIFNFLRLNIFS